MIFINFFKNKIIILIVLFIITSLIYFIFFKNFKSLITDFFIYENSLWEYIYILNNNIKSIILYLLIIIILSIINVNVYINKKNLISILIILLCLNYNYNYSFIETLKTNFEINSILTNGIILIHPILLYFGYAVIYVSIFFYIFNRIYLNKINILLKQIIYNILYIGGFSIILGSFWAQQELNWGGWWNWDFVEIIAVMFFLHTASFIHINWRSNNNTIFLNLIVYFYYFIMFFFIVRLDIFNSIHSFNNISFDEDFLLYILFFFLFITTIITKILDFNKLKFYKKINNNNIYICIKILNYIFLLYMCITMNFKFSNIDLNELIFYIKLLLILTIFILIIQFSKIPKSIYIYISFFFVFYISLYNEFFFLIFMLIIYNCFQIPKKIHFFLFYYYFFCFFNEILYNYDFIKYYFKFNINFLNNYYLQSNFFSKNFYENNLYLIDYNYHNNFIIYTNFYNNLTFNNMFILDNILINAYTFDSNYILININIILPVYFLIFIFLIYKLFISIIKNIIYKLKYFYHIL